MCSSGGIVGALHRVLTNWYPELSFLGQKFFTGARFPGNRSLWCETPSVGEGTRQETLDLVMIWVAQQVYV
jgi:hypothetical protein